MAPAIIAVFPAAGRVGIVRRQRDTLTNHRLLTRADEPVAFLADVLDELAAMIQPADRIVMTAVPWRAHLSGTQLLTGVVARALLLGALINDPLTPWAPLLVVPIRPFGENSLQEYPSALVGPREVAHAHGRLWVCRAAWDLAGVAAGRMAGGRIIDTARVREAVSA
jgi:hypothetical protein